MTFFILLRALNSRTLLSIDIYLLIICLQKSIHDYVNIEILFMNTKNNNIKNS